MYTQLETMHVQDVLRGWGRGKAMNTPPNGFPKSSVYAREMQNPGDGVARYHSPSLDDDCSGLVDRIVTSLKHRKPDHHKIIVCAYTNGLMDHQIAKFVRFTDDQGHPKNVSRSWVREKRKSAETWIEAKLDVYTGCENNQAVCIDRC